MTSATDLSGLSAAEATRRLAEHGPNELAAAEPTPAWRRFARQLRSPVVGLLAAAAVVAAAVGALVDAVAIATILLLDAVVGYYQEGRAERAILALRELTAPRARVRRDGRARIVAATEVVPGDLLLLEAGDVVAADARVVDANELASSEASLTGESLPVTKATTPAAAGAPLAERRDTVFLGTNVVRGTGTAEVVATGRATELGRISSLVATARDEATPLEQRLARVTRVLIVACLAIVAVVALLGFLRGRPALEIFLAAISLAVAAVPEGLPAVVTVALALGVQRMAARNVLVRRLPAVETLGSVSVVCTDKTGTLTAGKMAVREVWGPDEDAVLAAAAACCDAELPGDDADDDDGGIGDPTELAILAAAAERGIARPEIERRNPRRAVQPFDSERKRMSVLRDDGVLYVKGAPEVILALATSGTEGAEAASRRMMAQGLRILGVATGRGEAEADLHLVGLVGLADPPRPAAIAAVDAARRAGVLTVMITGDHPVTAHAIAAELGIVRDGEPDEDLVHARVTPEEKLAIVRRWKERREVVAMTGDGVNDAPALREAHVGIAMGRTGSEVAREAADMVLADDDFASLVAGIEEGRGIFANIRKTLVYLLTGNAAELAVMLVAALVGLPLPLLPLHLLWINLVTDGLPALALVTDPPEKDALLAPPRPLDEPILGRRQWRRIAIVGLVEATLTLGVFVWAQGVHDLDAARSLAFATLVFAELFRAFAARSSSLLYLEVGAFTNPWLLAVLAVSAIAQLALHHVPALRDLFGLGIFPPRDWLVVLAAALVPVTLLELSKVASRLAARRRSATQSPKG